LLHAHRQTTKHSTHTHTHQTHADTHAHTLQHKPYEMHNLICCSIACISICLRVMRNFQNTTGKKCK